MDGLVILNGYSVKVFDKTKVSTNNIQKHLNSIELVRGDFANKEDLKLAIRDTDYIFHQLYRKSHSFPSCNYLKFYIKLLRVENED